MLQVSLWLCARGLRQVPTDPPQDLGAYKDGKSNRAILVQGPLCWWELTGREGELVVMKSIGPIPVGFWGCCKHLSPELVPRAMWC